MVAEDDDSISSVDDLAGKTTAQSLTSNWYELATDSGAKVEAVEGWAQTSTVTAEELGRRFEDAGVAAIVYTDIARDGVLKGLNIPMTLALARAVRIPVIASGGLASLADIRRLAEPDCAVLTGAITGRAAIFRTASTELTCAFR